MVATQPHIETTLGNRHTDSRSTCCTAQHPPRAMAAVATQAEAHPLAPTPGGGAQGPVLLPPPGLRPGAVSMRIMAILTMVIMMIRIRTCTKINTLSSNTHNRSVHSNVHFSFVQCHVKYGVMVGVIYRLLLISSCLKYSVVVGVIYRLLLISSCFSEGKYYSAVKERFQACHCLIRLLWPAQASCLHCWPVPSLLHSLCLSQTLQQFCSCYPY